MSDYIVNALRVQEGVNMGDHGQDVTTAIDVRPDDTVGSVIEKHMLGGWPNAPQTDVAIVIRVAVDRDSEGVNTNEHATF